MRNLIIDFLKLFAPEKEHWSNTDIIISMLFGLVICLLIAFASLA